MTLPRWSSPVSEFRPYVPHAGTIGNENELVHRMGDTDLGDVGRVPDLDRVPLVPQGLKPSCLLALMARLNVVPFPNPFSFPNPF